MCQEKRDAATAFIDAKYEAAVDEIKKCVDDLTKHSCEIIVSEGDNWLRDTFMAALFRYYHMPVRTIVREHGIEAAIGYLNQHRNTTFGRTVLDVASKDWKREALTELIDGLQQILTPPVAVPQEIADERPTDATASP